MYVYMYNVVKPVLNPIRTVLFTMFYQMNRLWDDK